MLRALWKFMDRPAIWKFAQRFVFARYTVLAYKRMLAAQLRLTGKESVLDVGCGTGEYSQLLSFYRYVGVDFNEQYIRNANQAFSSDRVSFFQMDVADVPRLKIDFDAAFCIGVTHHLSDQELTHLVASVLQAGVLRFVIVDLLLPPVWKNPLSYALVRMDRGRYGRPKATLLATLKAAAAIESVSETFGFPHSVVGITLRRA